VNNLDKQVLNTTKNIVIYCVNEMDNYCSNCYSWRPTTVDIVSVSCRIVFYQQLQTSDKIQRRPKCINIVIHVIINVAELGSDPSKCTYALEVHIYFGRP
jgi:hypothetical protein